jgi:hypothetical protein
MPADSCEAQVGRAFQPDVGLESPTYGIDVVLSQISGGGSASESCNGNLAADEPNPVGKGIIEVGGEAVLLDRPFRLARGLPFVTPSDPIEPNDVCQTPQVSPASMERRRDSTGKEAGAD